MEFYDILKLLSDSNRLEIILFLKRGEVCVCDLAAKLNLEQSLLSHHLKKLKLAGVVNERKVGRWVHYSLNKDFFTGLEKDFQANLGSSGIHEKPCNLHTECCSQEDCNKLIIKADLHA